MEGLKEKLADLQKRLEQLVAKIDLEGKQKRARQIEQESARPDFWADKPKAESLMQELAELTRQQAAVTSLGQKLEEAKIGLQLDLVKESQAKLEEIAQALKQLELTIFLSGPYDRKNAIVSIHAGQGGVEAMDWAQMLERMYLRFAEKRGWQTDIVEQTPGDEAGIKSTTLRVLGPFTYGYLRGEAGVHRLVRQSPFNADRLRQTSFAKVEVLPEVEEVTGLEIREDDLAWEFFRASTQGGQNVQKVSSAVRLSHKPTGLVVTCQSQRYQEQNRKIALNLLRAKLWDLAEARAKEEEQRLKGEVKIAGWGNQIRSYVLHPYKMVKDLRTSVETSEAEKVLDGELDTFIEAELKSMV